MPDTTTVTRYRITVRGRVQGVGFRPTFYRALVARGCGGSIRNTPEGVVLEVEAPKQVLDGFVRDFREIAPSRARVDELVVDEVPPQGETDFRIQASAPDGRSLLPIPPDLATCEECKAEIRNCADRRHAYAFNTCTACGPRFSIALRVPFDRDTNTMREFPTCAECNHEYADTDDRRLHAQTVSCPACGPSLSFLTPQADRLDRPLQTARRMLKEGHILAIKGVGGFHLACDATREDVVGRLRQRKNRPAKPFAVMAPDLHTCRRICAVTEAEERTLTSAPSPIVLLETLPDSPVADAVAPGLRHLGVMLPYTPLHMLLFDDPDMPPALVMTSCNRSDEPIATSEEHVLEELSHIVDGILTHNRRIANRCDDSVVALLGETVLPMRRSRGYVPEPIVLEHDGRPVLATGGMLKNTFALTSGRRVFLSQHIGDVSDADNAEHFARSLESFSRLLRIEPEVVACDMHPDYPTTDFARDLCRRRGLPLIQVQHHHSHIASCLAEHGRPGPVIGVSLDGSGYGEDGAVWGGEFMVADRCTYERAYHLEYVPLPGGEQGVWNPCRMAMAHVAHALGPDEADRRMSGTMDDRERAMTLAVMDRREFSPLTSSAGRLFDAVAALIGVRSRVTYEGQAACELEARCAPGHAGIYEFGYDGERILVEGIFRGVCADLDAGEEMGVIAAKFHDTMAAIVMETCRRIRNDSGLACVALSGGVMQNRRLLSTVAPSLEADGFEVLLQTAVPANDGGLSLGQAACALARLRAEQGE